MTFIDWLILIPAIPLIPMAITWWLPWERWIPWGKIPKQIGIPYLWYLGGVAWHFRFPWWFVLCLAVTALVVTIYAILDVFGRKRDRKP